jgi:hypothetical protein
MKTDSPDLPAEAEIAAPPRPAVTVSFAGYTPPFDVAPIAQRMLDSVPQKYLIGLAEVVLTNSSGLPRKLRRSITKARKKKVRVVEARGLYHPAWNGNQPWIEIFVDNVLRGWEKGWWLKIGLFREGRLGDVLFHEIGHHIHFAARPEYREREDVADVWKVRLERNYYRQRFRWLRAFVRLLKLLLGPLFERQRMKLLQWELQKGQISRAEFEEPTRKNKTED